MRMPKGFGKNYFTLAAIQASVVQHHLDATSVRISTTHLLNDDSEKAEREEEVLETLLISPTLSLPTHAGHCDCYYRQRTRKHIRLNAKPQQNIQPYIYSNSVTSPP